MSKLKEEELLAWLNIWVRRWSLMSGVEKQAYQQIKEMIQKPGVDKGKLRIKPERMDHLEIGASIGKPREAPKVTEKFIGANG